MTEAVFYFFAATAVAAALLCITQRNAVSAAIWLVTTMLSLAAIYVLLGAQFIGIIQILVYAGAVMVLFLFVIMLLNLGHAPSDLRPPAAWVITCLIVGVLAARLLVLLQYTPERVAVEFTKSPQFAEPGVVFAAAAAGQKAAAANVVGAVAAPMFQVYLVPFEVTSILLLAAIIGAVVLAKRRV
jgi:NADH-quinone oxidoreductase subunit J